MPPQEWGVMTQKGDAAYLHVLDPDASSRLVLPGTEGLRPIRARIFGTDAPVSVVSQPNIEIGLPLEQRQGVDTIIEIEVA